MDPAVGVVKAYLELSGYFVLADLPVLVEAEDGYREQTDLDVVAVRLPHPPHEPLPDELRALDLFLGTDPLLGATDEGLDILIGEVKEGRAELNPAFRRAQTIAYGLHRVGCWPRQSIAEQTDLLLKTGRAEFTLRGGVRCRVRLVAFAGRGSARPRDALTVPLAHCVRFVRQRLREFEVAGIPVHFREPALGVLALQHKLGRPRRRGNGRHPDPAATAAGSVPGRAG